MGRLRRSRTHHSIRDTYRKYRTRNYARDLDQIHEDVKPENAGKLKNQPVDPDKPGLGQHYCIECARHFITEDALTKHIQTKVHKKRVKLLKEEPYTQAEADAAAGIGKADNGKRGGRSVAGDVNMDDAQ
ncbi:uncharacterized protein BYT42DRAFT_572534 [Radiomyces spectabilis]|uniref:uncharacterized protein n=1 Tax=Radiomyces spectabilis TaxID=64574 RepID=UPI0022205E0A|nr:uncharacterized protein BYT42DRAFT_572534 [Radiomyces spectabilis]KAI8378047.1 hypothetical protein BYT42DRAFT_572534 [Radiomyces spectabilis]